MPVHLKMTNITYMVPLANGAIHLRRVAISNFIIIIVIVIFLSLFINHPISFELNLCVQAMLAGFEGSLLVIVIAHLKSKV